MDRTIKLAEIRKHLESERENRITEMNALTEITFQPQDTVGIDNHLADEASEIFERERHLALRNNAQEIVDQLDAALQRIDEGTYGICAQCGQEINVERLEALPYAIYCITCQSEIERSR